MQKNSKIKADDRKGLMLGLFAFGLVLALVILPFQFRSEAGGKQTGGIVRTESHDERLGASYDIREDKASAEVIKSFRQQSGKDAFAITDLRNNFARGEQSLKQRIPHAKVEYNADIRTPEVITPDVWQNKIEFLSSPSSEKRSEILRGFVKQNNDLIGIGDSQADSLKVTADYTNPNGNMSFANLQQLINGVPVFRGEIKAGFTKNGQMIRAINNLAAGLDYDSLSADFRNPADSVKSAIAYIGADEAKVLGTRNDATSSDLKVVFGEGDWATTAEKIYFPTEPGVARTAWRVLIWQPVNAFYVIVDAETGTILWHKNITEDQTQSATYQVYDNQNAFMKAADSPAPLSPGPSSPTAGTQGVVGTRTNVAIVGNEAPNTFNNNGWITDGGNTTDGNAVEAGVDRDAVNGVDATIVGIPNRVFDSTWNPAPGNPAPGDDPLTPQAQRGAVIQMFYVMNRYHDSLYRLGFTEQSNNFQASNFGRGGVEADRVSAEGQDNTVGSACPATPCTNNANFSTPADGGRGRMQMYVWSGPTPDYDGTADAEVILHEVTHGTSNRLHGNGSGLSTNMSRGMGEGWSDFYAEAMLSEPTDPIDGIYTTGGYATFLITGGFTGNYYYGIRRFPRAPLTSLGANGRPHNPFTFRYINTGCAALIDGSTSAFPRGPIGSTQCDQVHNIGEVWSSMLWEVRNRMITRLGFTAGTTKVLQAVTDGMKLAPIAPNMLQERDAIIAAAAASPIATESAADVVDVREGFRVRGMGFSASIQSVSPAAVTEAFDQANVAMINPFSVSDSVGDNDGFPEPGENVLLSVAVTNTTGATVTAVTGNANGGTNVSYGDVANAATVVRQIPFTIPAASACGSMQQVTINIASSIGAQTPQVREFRLGAPAGGAPVTFTSATALTIPDSGASTPYGTTIVTSGLTGNKTITLEITGLTHTFPADLDYLLVGPGGQKYSLLSDSGDTGNVSALTFTLSDAAAAQPSATQWVAGDFRPVNLTTGDTFPAPAPAAPYLEAASAGAATFTSVFGSDGASMNGTWTLYLVDDVGGDFGTQAGWKLTFGSNDYLCSVAASTPRADFDGDGKTDLSVFRPSEGNWYLNRSTAGFSAVNWGISTDTIMPGDFDGDGKADEAVYRPSATAGVTDCYILKSSTSTFQGAEWGTVGDVPVIADFDGDNKDDVAIYRPSTNDFFVIQSSNGVSRHFRWGIAGDIPVPGDFDGDGKAEFAVFRPSNGTWYYNNSTGGAFVAVQWGANGDIPVFANYDGDAKDDIAVYRPSTGFWYLNRSTAGSQAIQWGGVSGDVPVPGDYDGDGKYDTAVYRAGTWFLNGTTSGAGATAFGAATDRPTPRFYFQ